MINNDSWQSNELAQRHRYDQRRRHVRRTALIAGAIALMFYSGFMLLGILGR